MAVPAKVARLDTIGRLPWCPLRVCRARTPRLRRHDHDRWCADCVGTGSITRRSARRRSAMDELDLQGTVRLGDRGPSVRRVQEWLSLNGLQVKVDGDCGPATRAAVREFESRHGLSSDGEVGAKLFELLTAPMRAALARIEPGGRPLGELTIAYAQQHLAQHPREIGGQNRGPWVRLYMSGHDGEEWAWCAGFACFCLRQACATLGA